MWNPKYISNMEGIVLFYVKLISTQRIYHTSFLQTRGNNAQYERFLIQHKKEANIA